MKNDFGFYRGSQYSYCNLELRFLQDNLSGIKNKDANVIVISSQGPDHSLTLVENNSLEFEVLTDADNSLAKKMGLFFSYRILYFLIIKVSE